jgi:hypothetical protein
MVIYHIDMVILDIDMGDEANDMGDDRINTVISHIDMGYLVTLVAALVELESKVAKQAHHISASNAETKSGQPGFNLGSAFT